MLLPLQRKLRLDVNLLLHDPVHITLHLGLELRQQRLDRRMKSSNLVLRRLDLVVEIPRPKPALTDAPARLMRTTINLEEARNSLGVIDGEL
jgi:hypothetical protein